MTPEHFNFGAPVRESVEFSDQNQFANSGSKQMDGTVIFAELYAAGCGYVLKGSLPLLRRR